MGKRFKKLRDFVSKNKKYLSLYLFLMKIANIYIIHSKSKSENYDDYTLFAVKKADNEYPILSRVIYFGNYFGLIRIILDIRNKSNHFVNGYDNNVFGNVIYFYILNIINPINKIYLLSYFSNFLRLLLLLNSSSQFKELLINSIFNNILELIIVFLVLRFKISNDYVRTRVSLVNGQWQQYFDVKTGNIKEREDLIITFNRRVILKILIPALSSGLIVGLRKIYEL